MREIYYNVAEVELIVELIVNFLTFLHSSEHSSVSVPFTNFKTLNLSIALTLLMTLAVNVFDRKNNHYMIADEVTFLFLHRYLTKLDLV